MSGAVLYLSGRAGLGFSEYRPGMRISSGLVPVGQAVAGFGAAVVNLGLLFGWYHWTTVQVAGVNLVVSSGISVVSALRASAQRSGRLLRAPS